MNVDLPHGNDNVPHDEGASVAFSSSSSPQRLSPRDSPATLASHGTYEQKDSSKQGGSSKRSARKAPPMEEDDRTDRRTNATLLLGTQSLLRPHPAIPLERATSQQPPIERPLLGSEEVEASTTTSNRFADADSDPSLVRGNVNEPTVESDRLAILGELDEPTASSDPPFPTMSIVSQTQVSSITPDSFLLDRILGIADRVSNTNDEDSRFPRSESFNYRLGNPRSILNERYQKEHSGGFTRNDFLSIRDSRGGDHVPEFTSIFVCPFTMESFTSGDWKTADLVVRRGGLNWYKKKKDAEFAAAGRAEDSFWFRSGANDSTHYFCNDDPRPARGRETEREDLVHFLTCAEECGPQIAGKIRDLLASFELRNGTE